MCGCLKREKDIRSTLGIRTRRVLRTIQICRSRLVIIIHQIRVVVLHTIVHNSYHDSCTRDPSIPYCIYFDVMSRVLCISLCTTCHTRRQHQSCASAKVLITRSSKRNIFSACTRKKSLFKAYKMPLVWKGRVVEFQPPTLPRYDCLLLCPRHAGVLA